jgi:hypothetical protein
MESLVERYCTATAMALRVNFRQSVSQNTQCYDRKTAYIR